MTIHGLQTAGSVDMSNSGDLRSFFVADLEHLGHEGYGVVLLEPFGNRVVEDRRGKRPEAFAALDLGIQNVPDVAAARIAVDRAVAERPRPPFHPPLEPADDLSVRNRLRGATAEFNIILNSIDKAADQVRASHLDQVGDSGILECWPPIGMIHNEASR